MYPTHDTKQIKKLDFDSWFDVEYHEYDNQLEQEISYDCLGDELLRAKQVRLYPTKKQRRRLLAWVRLTRWIYNYAVNYSLSGKCTCSLTNKRDFRNEVKAQLPEHIKKQIKYHKMPQRLMVEAIMDVSKAYKTAFSNMKAGNINHFRLRHKRKSKNRQGFVVSADIFSKTKNSFAVTALGEIKSSIPFPKTPKDSRLVYENGKFYLYVPQTRSYKYVTGRKEECSLDPGLRTFQALYDGTNNMKICNNAYSEIWKILKKIHKTKHRQHEPRIKKYHRRLYDKIIHKVDDLHWKTALFLVRNYNNILIGNFSTKEIVSRERGLYKSCKDPLLLLAHYKFRMRLASKAEEYRANVYEINEAYTSKTCGGCDIVYKDLGSKKLFNCPDCSWSYDRDFNGARNIMRKHHGDFHYIKKESDYPTNE